MEMNRIARLTACVPIMGISCLAGCINPKFDVHLHVAENAKGIVVIDSSGEGAEPGATITLPSGDEP